MGVSLHSYLIRSFSGRPLYLPKLDFLKDVVGLASYRPHTIVLFQVGYFLYSTDTFRIHVLRLQIFDLSDFAP